MGYQVWSEKEWQYLLTSLSDNYSISDALEDFWKKYPDREKSSIFNRLYKQGYTAGELLGKEAPTKVEKEKHRELTIDEHITIQNQKREISSLKARLRETQSEVVSSRKLLNFVHGLDENTSFDATPDWLTKEPKKSVTGIPVLFLSDLHFDEVVDPTQVAGVNEYNHDIAVDRIQRTFQGAIDLCTKYMHSPKYDGFVCALGGDLLSGNIHEELAETNEAPILQSAVDLTALLIEGLTALADTFGKIFVPCVVGNHGRLHHKPRAKNKVKDNYEWLIYHQLASHFSEDHRFTFLIPNGSDATFSIYNKTFLLTHGDQFRGGSGISGILSPLFIGQARKQKREQGVGRPFDIMICGHFHQLTTLESLIINGSTKGLDEYAYQKNFGYEPAQQALWVVHPSMGITYRMPIVCDPPKKIKIAKENAIKYW